MSLCVRFGHKLEDYQLRLRCRKADATCYISILTTQLFWELDAHLEEAPESQSTVQAVDPVDHRLKINDQIGVTLSCAMHAYAAQWLPLVSQAYDLPFSHVQDIITERWRAARKAMLKAINRPTYRSMLALYLFAQTPMPVGISEDEESDGLSGAVCMQTALSQLQQLRAQRTTGQLDNSISTLASSDIPPQYIDYENRAYWTAMIWETSISLTSNSRTFLTSGLRGACSEPTWRLVKAFLVGSFIPRTLQWHNVDLEVTHDVANEIISVASISKTYIWKNISSVKEALREGVHDDGVLFAWKALLEAIGIFSTSIRPLLGTCQRQLQQLDQSVRLMWYQTYLQYHLGILFLVDALEAAARSDLLEEIGAIKLNAENECFNILRFGLNNTYTVEISSTADRNNSFPGQIVTASLVAIDPCPQHVIDCVHLMHKVVCRRFNQKATTHENYIREMSDLRKILGQLPQSSKSVQKALTLEFLGTA
jgi:hypothetical protein